MKTLLALTVLLCMAVCACAQAKPDFSGEWTLNHDQSKFGDNYRPPSKWVDTVSHKDSRLIIARMELTHAGKRESNLVYTTDGKDCANEVIGNAIKSTVTWDAQALKLHHVSKFNDTEMTLDEKWTLSPDGKKLQVTRHFEGQGLSVDQTVIFDKTGR